MLPWALLLIVAVMVVYGKLKHNIEAMPLDVFSSFLTSSQVILALSVSLIFIIVYLMVKKVRVLRLVGRAFLQIKLLEVGDSYVVLMDSSGRKYSVGAVALEGSLHLDESNKTDAMRYLLLINKTASLFESLRDNDMDFIFIAGNLRKPLLPVKNNVEEVVRYPAVFMIRSNTPEELVKKLNYVRSACMTALPELEAKVLKAHEILNILSGFFPLRVEEYSP